jgi:hypothetical protein
MPLSELANSFPSNLQMCGWILNGQVERMGRLFPVIIALIAREFIWKAIALWKAGTHKQLPRFICILIFNTMGILPIIYLAFFQRKSETPEESY